MSANETNKSELTAPLHGTRLFRRILVANRGEIALRIIRACRELGIESVAVHSSVDAESLHVKFADHSVCIGPGLAKQSYLHIPAIIAAAEITGADAIHPGYGFLAESAEFAEVCARCGITFIGPKPHTMQLMGTKTTAREALRLAGVPVVPGSAVLENDDQARRAAEEIGYPVILKAAAGGGGRGMKVVDSPDRLIDFLHTARSEAAAGFSCPDVYLERYLDHPRHIEVQILADLAGEVVALGERECSIQRRHQKLVEEAPSPALTDEERESLLDLCTRAMRQIGYSNLGTLEFLMDQQHRLYFMEMNTRIQVEHPVTEMITGLDLVREQIQLAAGNAMWPMLSRRFRSRGHAIECRINAEDPATFAPSPGRITALHLPGGLGVRVDTHIYQGYVVPPQYDSLLAKLIVHAENRPAALARLKSALNEFVIEGIKTNLDFHRHLVEHPDFISGNIDTGLVERLLPAE